MSVIFQANAQLPNWTYTTTSTSHLFNFPTDVIVCSQDTLEIGDYLGVFYDSLGSLACGGYFIWNGGNQDVIAYGDDTATTVIEGFAINEEIVWKSFQMDVGLEYIHEAIYAHSPIYPDSGIFEYNGASQLVYLGNCVTPIFQVESEPTDCFGGNTGIAFLNILEFNPPYTFLWSTGSTNDSILNLNSDYYYVTITNSLGYQSSDSIFITQPDSLFLLYDVTHVSEVGLSIGSIDITVNGGTSPFTFLWNNGTVTEDLNNVFTGEYAVTIIDYNGCVDSDSIEVLTIVPLPWVIEETNLFHKVLVLEGINITIDGVNLQEGDYLGVFYDSLGIGKCAGALYFNSYTLESDSILKCFGDIDSTIAKEGFSQGEDFKWRLWDASTGNEIIVFPAYTITPAWPNEGNFVVDGHSAIATITDIEHDLGISAWLSPNHYCNLTASETVILEIFSNGMITDYSFDIKYNINGGPWLNETFYETLNYQDTIQVSLSTPANLNSPINYHLIAFIEGNNDMVWENDTIEIDIYPLITSTVSVPDTLLNCVGEASVFVTGGTPPYLYLWNDPNSQQNDTAINLCVGIYEVTITDSLNCIVNQYTNIENILPPAYTSTFSNISCYGASDGYIDITLNSFEFPILFEWSNTSFSEDLYNISPGIYIITITDGTGLSVNDTFIISQPDSLQLESLTTNIQCWGGSTGNIDIDINGGTLPYHFNWSNGETTEDISNLPTGGYAVTATDSNNCNIVQAFSLTQPDQIQTNFQHFHVSSANAYDGSINLSISGGTTPYTFEWSNGSSTEDLTFIGEGVYSLTVTDNNNCEYLFDAITIFEPLPTISGMVHIGPNLLVNGIAVLYKRTEANKFEAVNYTTIYNGYYSFTINNVDSFLVYAIPPFYFPFNTYPSYFPTYFSDNLNWKISTRIKTLSNIYNADIYLNSYNSIFYGEGNVSGQINFFNFDDYETHIYNNTWFENNNLQNGIINNPARNITLLLLNDEGLPVSYCLSDINGFFEFKNIELGNYSVYAEKAGFITHPYNFSIDLDNPIVEDLQVYIFNGEIFLTSEKVVNPLDFEIKIFPVPVEEFLYVKIPTQNITTVRYKIINCLGQDEHIITNYSIENNTLVFDVQKLSSGIYYLILEFNNNIKSEKFIIP